jgi:hypothetical protein
LIIQYTNAIRRNRLAPASNQVENSAEDAGPGINTIAAGTSTADASTEPVDASTDDCDTGTDKMELD